MRTTRANMRQHCLNAVFKPNKKGTYTSDQIPNVEFYVIGNRRLEAFTFDQISELCAFDNSQVVGFFVTARTSFGLWTYSHGAAKDIKEIA